MQARRKIAVAGATGRVGRHVVDVLGAAGHDVVPISRSGGVDVITGAGLGPALTGVDCVIDLPSMRTQLVAARPVAEALVDLATAPDTAPAPGAPIPEIAGPREESLVDMAALLAARRGDPVKIEGVRNPADPELALMASG